MEGVEGKGILELVDLPLKRKEALSEMKQMTKVRTDR